MKKEYIILALIIAALSAYLILHRSDSTHYTLPVLDDLSGRTVTRIELNRGEATLVLEKNGNDWVVGPSKLPAMATLAGAMVTAVRDLTLTALVSESKSYTRYDLDEAHRIRVTAFADGKAVRTFDVGKVAGSFNHTFVKIDGDHRVYHAAENIKTVFDKTENALLDKKVLAFDSTTVNGLTVKDGDISLALERKRDTVPVDVTSEDNTEENAPSPPPAETWVDASGSEKDTDKVTALISLISRVTCESYVPEKAKDAWAGPVIEITVSADRLYTLSVFPPADETSSFPAVSSESAFSFLIPRAKVDDIRKKIGDI
ncbi:hypothetical protein JCM14469_11380 [Desulfatiferula olefinivorans]